MYTPRFILSSTRKDHLVIYPTSHPHYSRVFRRQMGTTARRPHVKSGACACGMLRDVLRTLPNQQAHREGVTSHRSTSGPMGTPRSKPRKQHVTLASGNHAYKIPSVSPNPSTRGGESTLTPAKLHPSIHWDITLCRALLLPKQSPRLLGTILNGSPLRHRIPASWHSFCRPRKDDRQSQPHLGLIQQPSGI